MLKTNKGVIRYFEDFLRELTCNNAFTLKDLHRPCLTNALSSCVKSQITVVLLYTLFPGTKTTQMICQVS